jgi:hypothetical protein
MRTLIPFALLVATACGGASIPPEAPAPAATEAVAATPQEQTAPFPRVTALPAAPHVVLEVDVAALRPTPVRALLDRVVEGESAGDVVMQRLLERCERAQVALYRETETLVLIARGPLDGVLAEVAAELERRGEEIAERTRYGLTTYLLESEMVGTQTAPDTVVLTFPQHVDEILRVAVGQAPAVPLPPELRALEQRAGFADAAMSMRFLVRREGSVDALDGLLTEAGAAGVVGHVEGDRVRVSGSARVPIPGRAAAHGQNVQALLRTYTDADARSPALGEAIRRGTVQVDGDWVELGLEVQPSEIEGLMRILTRLAGI